LEQFGVIARLTDRSEYEDENCETVTGGVIVGRRANRRLLCSFFYGAAGRAGCVFPPGCLYLLSGTEGK